MSSALEQRIAEVEIGDGVRLAHPSYVAVVIATAGLVPGEPNERSETLLRAAEDHVTRELAGREPHELPEVAAWREAYASFGVKPRDARSSVEALMRRIPKGLPRIDRLTDTYNAVSLRHLVPVGGEDFSGYVGAARLVIADGSETFDTVADGEAVVQNAEAGEVVWRDDVGVTCRRWNWRQCVRTRLSTQTTQALFIIDSLGPNAHARAVAAAEELLAALAVDSPEFEFAVRTLT